MHELDYYELLGVDRTASMGDIKSAYRALAKTTHPDAGGDSTVFGLLQVAYETLSEPVSRSYYDRTLIAAENRFLTSAGLRPRTRRPSFRQRRTMGNDPSFVPMLPDLEPEAIPWWNLTEIPGVETRAECSGDAPKLAVLGGVPLLALSIFTPITWSFTWIAFAAALTGIIAWLARRHLLASRSEEELVSEFGDEVVFGRPGTDHDQVGEQLTAELLSHYLTKIPGVRIFHSLALPGSVFADIHHAVLSGNRLVLVESKLWPPGHYSTDSTGALLRNGGRFRGGSTQLPAAIRAYRRLLPNAEIRGALVVYPNRAGLVSADEVSGSIAPPMNAEQFVLSVGSWLTSQQSTIDRELMKTLVDQVVSS